MRSQTIHDRANINVEVSVAPFSTGERRRRGKSDKLVVIFCLLYIVTDVTRRTLEMATTIKQTFEPVVQTSLYPRSQIDVYILVLQQDGGLLAACVNATTLALSAAGVPLTDLVCAISAGAHGAAPLLDLTTLEENDVPSATVASMPRSGRLSLVTMETRLHVDRFEEIFTLAGEAGKVIHKEMRTKIRERAKRLVDAMGATGPGAVRSAAEARERGAYDERMDEY
jgi:exosome complex component RRP41